jgi:hypothetical protein
MDQTQATVRPAFDQSTAVIAGAPSAVVGAKAFSKIEEKNTPPICFESRPPLIHLHIIWSQLEGAQIYGHINGETNNRPSRRKGSETRDQQIISSRYR